MQTLPSSGDDERSAAWANGFSLHAAVVAAADERGKLERLCRTITRPAVSTERLSLTTHGYVHYRLKTPYRDGKSLNQVGHLGGGKVRIQYDRRLFEPW